MTSGVGVAPDQNTPKNQDAQPDSPSREALIERVAEAIFDVEYPRFAESAHPDSNRWTWRGVGHSEAFRQTYRLYAAAAVDALLGSEVAS